MHLILWILFNWKPKSVHDGTTWHLYTLYSPTIAEKTIVYKANVLRPSRLTFKPFSLKTNHFSLSYSRIPVDNLFYKPPGNRTGRNIFLTCTRVRKYCTVHVLRLRVMYYVSLVGSRWAAFVLLFDYAPLLAHAAVIRYEWNATFDVMFLAIFSTRADNGFFCLLHVEFHTQERLYYIIQPQKKKKRKIN